MADTVELLGRAFSPPLSPSTITVLAEMRHANGESNELIAISSGSIVRLRLVVVAGCTSLHVYTLPFNIIRNVN